MKRKFLAKAITLGLMLAVPLGAQAKTIITATDENKIFPDGLKFAISSANAGDYNGGELHFYDVTKAGEEVKNGVTFTVSDFDNGANKIITVNNTADNAVSTITGDVNVTANNIKGQRITGIYATGKNNAITTTGNVNLNVKDGTLRAAASGRYKTVQLQKTQLTSQLMAR